ncbi:MAG: 50S ribosomal protein L29 [Chitinophagales bacterium]|nr:50S ribosomal protein L29 [Chitinophagales bacterium]MDW8427555.1 50S ribosomal protein L29 [Chitinophagales bacterium]
MPRKKLNLADLTDQELMEKLRDDKALYQKLRFQHAVSPLENPMRLRQMRRDIARILTEITKRKKAAQSER